jgi:DNA-binding transcriptional LysR family regulator
MIMRGGNVMVAPRRFLPSIDTLLALEGVARSGSVTAVAEQLSLTQSAVSRQLQRLEEQLEVALFIRDKKRLKLTPAGAEYAGQVREALKQIAQASLNLKANPSGGSLNLAILPTFGMLWLAPRLADFAQRHPEITVNLTTRLRPFDFDTEKLDAAIHFGEADWPDAGHLKLMTETVVPACAPTFKSEAGIETPADLFRKPLLHLTSRPNAWRQWFASNGVAPPPLTGMLFDQFGAMAQAAVHGLGVALLPEFLIERELADGSLVSSVGGPVQSVGAYYLVWPNKLSQHSPVIRFREWLARAARG